jgi:hypothetical protein
MKDEIQGVFPPNKNGISMVTIRLQLSNITALAHNRGYWWSRFQNSDNPDDLKHYHALHADARSQQEQATIAFLNMLETLLH